MLSSKQADSASSLGTCRQYLQLTYSPVGFLAVTFPYLIDSEDEDIVPPKFPIEPEENCEEYSVSEGGVDLDPSEPESGLSTL